MCGDCDNIHCAGGGYGNIDSQGRYYDNMNYSEYKGGYYGNIHSKGFCQAPPA